MRKEEKEKRNGSASESNDRLGQGRDLCDLPSALMPDGPGLLGVNSNELV